MDKDYMYRLELTDGDSSNVVYSFPGFIDLDELKSHLQRFLLACDWSEDQMKQLFKEEYYE